MKKEVTLQESLITDLRTLINEARNKVALMVNKLSHHWRDNELIPSSPHEPFCTSNYRK